MQGKLRKVLSLLLTFGLLFQQIGFAQVAAELNIGSYLSGLGNNFVQDKFRPLHLRYFSYDALNDNFKVLLDKGDIKNLEPTQAQEATQTLLGYFLVGITLPDDSLWVNLRPDSDQEIIDSYLEKTDIGKIMLEADLQLKKDTANFTSPSTPEGKKYWDKLYKKAAELFGTENVNIPTLTRPWIVPGEIIVRETADSAYIYKATLKVMLESDYLNSTNAISSINSTNYSFKDLRLKALNDYSSQLIRELIIPKLTKEVNSSKRYANLRQAYYSLILSRWFKMRFSGKSGTYASLINTRNLTNLTSQTPWSKTTYFKQYQQSFAKGEYNIKEPVYTPTGQVIRSYFSGGIQMASSAIVRNGISAENALPEDVLSRHGVMMTGSRGLLRVSSALNTSEKVERAKKDIFDLLRKNRFLTVAGLANSGIVDFDKEHSAQWFLDELASTHWTVVKSKTGFYYYRPFRLMVQANDRTNMLLAKSLGADGALVGHSEVRQAHNLNNTGINVLLRNAHTIFGGINVMAMGEPGTLRYPKGDPLEGRLKPEGWNFLNAQITEGLKWLSKEEMERTIIAYEPIWSIGRDAIRPATPKEAQEVHQHIRGIISSSDRNKAIIQYGGSMKKENAAGLMNETDVDGGLIGGASLTKEAALGLIKTVYETLRKQKEAGNYSKPNRIPVIGFNFKAEIGGSKMEASYLEELMDIFKFIQDNLSDIDLENDVRIYFAVPETEISLFDRALRGENPKNLINLQDANLPNKMELAVHIEDVSQSEPGAHTSEVTAEALRLAGVKGVLVTDKIKDDDPRVIRAKGANLKIIKLNDVSAIDSLYKLQNKIEQANRGEILVVHPALAREAYAIANQASSSIYSLGEQLNRLDKFVRANRGKGSTKGLIEEIYASVYAFISKTATYPSFGVGIATRGATGINEVAQAGTSSGKREPITLSPKDTYQTKELEVFEKHIKPLLIGKNVADILNLDKELERIGRSLKPTPESPDLIYAGPAITATSMALVRALARSANVDEEVVVIYMYNELAKEYGAQELGELTLPIPMAKGNDGGVHGATFTEMRTVDGQVVSVKIPKLPYQEFMLAPMGSRDFIEALVALRKVTKRYYELVKEKYLTVSKEIDAALAKQKTSIAAILKEIEGKNSEPLDAIAEANATLYELINKLAIEYGFGAEAAIKSKLLTSNTEVLAMMTQAIKDTDAAGVFIVRDDAASELYNHPGKPGLYYLGADGTKYFNSADGYITTQQKIEYDKMLIQMFPRIASIEDGFSEEDPEGWIEGTKQLGDRVLMVGDDVFVTAPEIAEDGCRRKMVTALLDKLNQAGTVSRALKSIIIVRTLPVKLHNELPWLTVSSHRSGEPAEQNMMSVISLITEFIKTTVGSILGGGQGREAKINYLTMTYAKWLNRGQPLEYAGKRILENPQRGFEKIVSKYTREKIYTAEDLARASSAVSIKEQQTILKQISQKTDSKIFFLVIDGVGGLPIDGATELEAAYHPNLNRLLRESDFGLVDIMGIPGIPPGSGPGHFAIFGYDPFQTPGRGILDSLGEGIDLRPGDIAMRGNFATLDNGIISDRRAGRIGTHGDDKDAPKEIIKLLSGIKIEGVEFIFHHIKEHRVAVVIRGENIALPIGDSDPGKEGLAPSRFSGSDTSQAERLADLMNKLTAEVNRRLENNSINPKANTVIFRGADTMKEMPPSLTKLYKLTPAAICTYPTYIGIGRTIGMEVLPVSGTKSLEDQIATLEKNADDYDFFYIHVKATDKYGEDGKFDDKVKVIEEVDELIPKITKLMNLGRGDTLIVTGDHSTPAIMKLHSDHPVPILIFSKFARPLFDGSRFTETDARKGSLGMIPGSAIMPLALGRAGKLTKIDGPIPGLVSSPMTAEQERSKAPAPGGIDLRTLPMSVQAIGSFSGLNFRLPQLSQAQLEKINVDAEIQQVNDMINRGICPSGERLRELIAACVQKGKMDNYADNLLLCLIDICRLQEENADESSPELRMALLLVDAQK